MKYKETNKEQENLNKYSHRDIKKPSIYLNYYDDINVISRDKFDDKYNSYDFVRNDELFDEDDKFNNYRELDRHDSIVSFIDEDKSYMQNYDNFQKNNIAFYSTIKDQIFAETYRILGANKNNLDSSNHNDLSTLEKKYSTNIKDVDKIIAIASEKDKKLLNLIVNDNEEIEALKKKASSSNQSTTSKTDDNDEHLHVNDVPPQPISDLANNCSVEDTNKTSQVSAPPKVPSTNNDELISQPKKEYPNPILLDDSLINKSSNDEFIVRPRKDIEETEYVKINNMINSYRNDKNLNTFINKSTKPLSINDALFVNLQEKFYISENDLTRQRNNQKKVISDVLSDYQNTFNENVRYEVKKEVQNINAGSKSLFNYQNLNSIVSNENAKNVAILKENDDLKAKIKLLEKEIKKNVNEQRDLDSKKDNLESQIEKVENEIKEANEKKILEAKFKAIPTMKTSSTPNFKNYTNVLKTNSNEINQQIIHNKQEVNDNNLMVVNSAANNESTNNYNIPRVAKNSTFVNNLLNENQNPSSLNEAKKNKPFTYYEANNNSFLNNKINFTSEINSIKSQNVSSLQNAINSKKQELFQSFNNNPDMLNANPTSASKTIFSNKFSDIHGQEQKVSLREAMGTNNKKRDLF